MSKKTNKPQAVIDAESEVMAINTKLCAAREVVKQLEVELVQAHERLSKVMVDVDAGMPQCQMTRILRSTGKVFSVSRVVILRKTPGGRLVVRQVGSPQGTEYKFRWVDYTGKFIESLSKPYLGSYLELCDVPESFLPQTERK